MGMAQIVEYFVKSKAQEIVNKSCLHNMNKVYHVIIFGTVYIKPKWVWDCASHSQNSPGK